ncbi:NAD-dependent epimerase/dehydratase family protein [Streptosporangium lutulentum]|uniref:Nucleoside-diphosphate-sugar epimerase n=1 Tax=Streptosporangium lutulentum TaxID=1461250 RepID=A0ABT9QDW7_9ACTN|nr:NAD(P)-dependent oxidoreductase [Streptosporangium lutulentum]MDP9844967.1 nucleoside-diphosphate-sugar epimerase [Streptosporangium lutulentum]
MTILVTGATGRVGSRFVPRLLQQGEPVRVLVRDPVRAAFLGALGAEVVVGDLRDTDALDDVLKGAEVVVHLGAAFRGVSDEEAVAVNHAATVELAVSALRSGVTRFVYASTTLAYGSGRGRPALEADELVPPGRAYPTSKAGAEKALLRLHRDEGLPLRVARLAFVYGDGDPHLAESLLWARDWPSHKRLHLVHHADVAQALLRVVRADGADGEAFNVADDAPVTALELLNLNGEPVAGEAADRTLDDPWEGIADTSKIRRELGFRPIHPTVHAAKDAGAL